MGQIDAITAVLRAIDAGQRPILLESWTGVKHELSPLTHAFIVANLVNFEQVECSQPLPEWEGSFPDGDYYHITMIGHKGLIQIAMPANGAISPANGRPSDEATNHNV